MNFYNLIETFKYNPSEIHIKLAPKTLADLVGMPTYLQFHDGLEKAIYHNITNYAKLHYPNESIYVRLSNNFWHIVCPSKDAHHFIYKVLKTFDDRAMEIYEKCIKGNYSIGGGKIAENLDNYLFQLIEELHLRKQDHLEHPRYKHKINNFFKVTEHRDNYIGIQFEMLQIGKLENVTTEIILCDSLRKAIISNCSEFRKAHYPEERIYISEQHNVSINSSNHECHKSLLKTLKEFSDMSEIIYYEMIQDKKINEENMTNYLTTLLSKKILESSLPLEAITTSKHRYKL